MIQHCDACALQGHPNRVATHQATRTRALGQEVAQRRFLCEKHAKKYFEHGWSTISLALLWEQEQEHEV